ncbi:MAG TPA: RNA 2',3'-cyclic phosphodiesterase [Thermomicrobiales bacterium]|nr:RNA 2',3'-cyclic phosphodiesterase [Thermomicrobiales bacterium]
MTRRNYRVRGGEYWRLFVAVPVPAAVKAAIAEVQAELKPLDWPFRWVDPELAHVTLKFLGDSNPRKLRDLAGKLAWAAERAEPVDLTTGALGAFPSTRRPRVAWLGLEGDTLPLERLADDVDEVAVELGYPRERKRFQPHITIGRLRNREDPPADFETTIVALDQPAREMPVERIQLVRSVLGPSGPSYAVIDEWRLGQEARAPRALNHG